MAVLGKPDRPPVWFCDTLPAPPVPTRPSSVPNEGYVRHEKWARQWRVGLGTGAVVCVRLIEPGLAERTFQPVAMQKNLSFRAEFAPGAPTPITTEGDGRADLRNLLANALKFTEEGSVSLRSGCTG